MLANRAPVSFNTRVLNAIKKMPKGGGYAATDASTKRVAASTTVSAKGELMLNAKLAMPGYCSGATYLVFLHAIQAAVKAGEFRIHAATANALCAHEEKDGIGVWGRWNANGPGTAGLFHAIKLGRNFESYATARPGDFMKIFWSNEIGEKEFGHSVVFLGTYQKKGQTMVKFWSSNQPSGYGEKSVSIDKIKWAIFSRVTDIRQINRVTQLKTKDPFLASMLSQSYSRSAVRKKVGIKKGL